MRKLGKQLFPVYRKCTLGLVVHRVSNFYISPKFWVLIRKFGKQFFLFIESVFGLEKKNRLNKTYKIVKKRATWFQWVVYPLGFY